MRLPWEPESAKRAELAMTALRQLLLQRVVRSGSQTLLVAAGALVGFAAQNAALEQGELLTQRRDLVAPESLMLRQAADGKRYLLGRWINAPLLLGYGHAFPLQRVVVQAAAAAGVTRDKFPDFWELERTIAKAAAEADFGGLAAGPGREPVAKPQDVLKAIWPAVRRLLIAPMPMEHEDEPPLNEAHWPMLLAIVAGRLQAQASTAMDPAVAAAMVMEAAIIASKLHPDLVEPGRWKVGPGPRGLQIIRDDRQRKIA
ncbi:MAG: hypothetical protein ACJ798_04440 [Phenylobacterium sp.]